jgi:hypothetical protein
MRAVLVLTAGLAAALLFSGFRGSAAGLSEISVCGVESFDEKAGHCTANAVRVTSRTLYCSARVSGHAGDRFTGAFTFKGRHFPTQRGAIAGDGWYYTYLTIGGGAFPGGKWSCKLTAGDETATQSFTSTGPIGIVTSTAACPTSRTVAAGPVRACKQDESARPLRRTSNVTCSAVYSSAVNRKAKVDVLFEGDSTGLAVTRKIPLPVSVFGVQISKPGGLPAGTYECVFSLDGKSIATKAFSIG